MKHYKHVMYESRCNVSTCPKGKPISRLSNNMKYILYNTATSLRKTSEYIGAPILRRSNAT
jgi:hypothetical protein